MDRLLRGLLLDLKQRYHIMQDLLANRSHHADLAVYVTGIRSFLDSIGEALGALLDDPDLGAPTLLINQFQDYEQLARALFMVEAYPLPAILRYSGVDHYWYQLSRRIAEEISYPFEPPVVFAGSREYYWTYAPSRQGRASAPGSGRHGRGPRGSAVHPWPPLDGMAGPRSEGVPGKESRFLDPVKPPDGKGEGLMGTFRVAVEIGDPEGSRWEMVDALVDTRATYTVVPTPLLARLGVRPARRWPFELADGREIEREIGYTMIRIDGEAAPTIVVFGPEGYEPLLGAYTLEGLRLAADPVRRRLIPVPGLLMGARQAPLTWGAWGEGGC